MMNNRRILLMLLSITIVALNTKTISARPITYYQYFSVVEPAYSPCSSTFTRADTLWGAVRSNDMMGIKYDPTFHSWFITSAPEFRDYYADPIFAIDPIFNAPEMEYPEQFHHIRNRADIRINGQNGQYMTRLHLHEGQLDIHQYETGAEVNLEFVLTFEVDDIDIILIEGEVELYGELTGELTIYATDDIYLIDDIRYVEADENGRWDEENDPGGILGIVSEGNIIIKDNWANGKRNSERGSNIVINSSLVALGGSFTFEHQNNDWELYQGPFPDERGYIYLKGSVAQRRRALTHVSNHMGTGYGKRYRYDQRLTETGPPGFDFNEYPFMEVEYEELHLELGHYYFRNTVVDELVIGEGVEIFLEGANSLTVRGDIELNGSEERPINVRTRFENQSATFRGEWGRTPIMKPQYVNFGEDITVHLNADSVQISNCKFADEIVLNGNIRVKSCEFNGELTLDSVHDFVVTRSIFTNGVVIDGEVSNGSFINNTVVGAPYEGLLINRFQNLRIANNIISNNRWGIVNWFRHSPELEYNNLYANNGFDYTGCEAGEGSISADPLFVNYDDGDYNLAVDSPCIDAGDPDSPPDLDGSRADMGAQAYNHELSVSNDLIVPGDFTVSPYPNPFNDVVKIKISASNSSTGNWRVTDLQGRVIAKGTMTMSTGSNDLILNGKTFKKSGLYFLDVAFNNLSIRSKLVYLR